MRIPQVELPNNVTGKLSGVSYISRQICITTAAGQKYIIPLWRLSKVISVGAPNKLLARTLGYINHKTRQGFIDHPYQEKH